MVRFLLDTHTVIWFAENDGRLGAEAADILESERAVAFLSHASVWEIAIKYGTGKLKLHSPPSEYLRPLFDAGLRPLPIAYEHALAVASLPRHHGDPFDRMLIAQAQIEGLILLSSDATLDQYGVKRVW